MNTEITIPGYSFMLFYAFKMTAKIQNQEKVRKTCHIIFFLQFLNYANVKQYKKTEKNCLHIRNAMENMCLQFKNFKKISKKFQKK